MIIGGMRATRVMKARRETHCPLCYGPISVGHQIGLVEGRGWCCVLCIIATQKGPAMTATPDVTLPAPAVQTAWQAALEVTNPAQAGCTRCGQVAPMAGWAGAGQFCEPCVATLACGAAAASANGGK